MSLCYINFLSSLGYDAGASLCVRLLRVCARACGFATVDWLGDGHADRDSGVVFRMLTMNMTRTLDRAPSNSPC
jgi:hypothetical protein